MIPVSSGLELADEIQDVIVDLLWFFLVNEVTSPFNYNNVLQTWHIALEGT